ncbi:mitochondrial carrier domain-containing protein [Chytriomyces cf. hyalinus JEL632]|nr:mitochondrial carrier domain-containing protein [Chytriomyces cf. hyalinus JEL632]
MVADAKGNFIFGAVGGVCNVVVSHPFDLFSYRNGFHAVSQILRADGPTGLYRGVSPVLIGAGPVMGVCYLSPCGSHSMLYGPQASIPEGSKLVDTLPIQYVALAGACASIPTSLILGPAKRIKILMQVQTSSNAAASPAALSRGVLAVFNPLVSIWSAIRTNGGIPALFRGTAVTMLRDFPGDAAYFVTFEGIKRTLKEVAPTPRHNWGSDKYTFSPLQTVLAGGLAGCANWLICIPIDSIKTQVQQSSIGANFFSVLRSQASVARLYRGLGPVLLRAFPASGAFLLGVETARTVYQSM